MANTINIFSLCSGVAWLDEGVRAGLEFLGFGHRVLGYCERDAYAAACLLARMEDASLEPAPVWCGNLEDMDRSGLVDRVDLLTAGFPCQPWSSAGKQKGTGDARWLWPAICEIIADVRPRMVFLENVPGLVSGCGINHVLDSLAVLGFDAEWLDLEAAEVGASHKRRRVFILAYDRGARRREAIASEKGRRSDVERHGEELADAGLQHRDVQQRPQRISEHQGSGSEVGDANGPRTSKHASRSGSRDTACESSRQVADAKHAERRAEYEVDAEAHGREGFGRRGGSLEHTERNGGRIEKPGRRSGGRTVVGGAVRSVADTGREGLSVAKFANLRESWRRNEGRTASELCGAPLFALGPSDVDGWNRVVADGSFDFRAPAVKPGVRVLANGCSLVVDESRADQLRCSGNGVVAAQAGAAFVELFRRLMTHAI